MTEKISKIEEEEDHLETEEDIKVAAILMDQEEILEIGQKDASIVGKKAISQKIAQNVLIVFIQQRNQENSIEKEVLVEETLTDKMIEIMIEETEMKVEIEALINTGEMKEEAMIEMKEDQEIMTERVSEEVIETEEIKAGDTKIVEDIRIEEEVTIDQGKEVILVVKVLLLTKKEEIVDPQVQDQIVVIDLFA